MSAFPVSPREQTGGFAYFPRMLDKIRRHARGELSEDYHPNLGQGADGLCCGFLHVDYAQLTTRVLQGGTDEEILVWCQEHGRPLNDTDRHVWNGFILKLGWNDFATPRLRRMKEKCGLAERDDILTMPDYIDADEGREVPTRT